MKLTQKLVNTVFSAVQIGGLLVLLVELAVKYTWWKMFAIVCFAFLYMVCYQFHMMMDSRLKSIIKKGE